MKKKQSNEAWYEYALLKTLRIMRLTLGLFLITIVQGWAINSYSQKVSINLDLKNTDLIKVLDEIENQTDFYFLFNYEQVHLDKKFDVKLSGAKIDEALKQILDGTGLDYQINNRQIVITKEGIEQLNDPSGSSAQQKKSINGKVVDFTGVSLPGVTVVVKGTTNGTITDIDGKYYLNNIPANATLQFSFVGMKTQEMVIGDKTIINVTLAEETVGIEEVVAVGYGTQKKVNLTGAVSQISNKEIEARPVTNTQRALQGLVSNLNITTTARGGEPGADMSMNIRGLTTIQGGSNAPYVLVDGVPMDMNTIDPENIESISVLKDAASAAIYGARAAYGVVLITTKSGAKLKDKVRVNFATNFSLSQPTVYPQVVDALTCAYVFNDAAKNAGLGDYYTPTAIDRIKQYMADPTSIPSVYPLANNPAAWDNANLGLGANANTNWKEVLFKNWGTSNKNSLSISGGGNLMDYYFSAGYIGESGIMRYGNEYNKAYNIDGKVNSKITKWSNFSFMFKYSRGVNDYPWDQLSGRGRMFDMITKLKPTMPLWNPNYPDEFIQGPVAAWQTQREKNIRNNFVISPRIKLEPIKNWVTSIDLNYTINANQQTFTAEVSSGHNPDGSMFYSPSQSSTSYLPAIRTNYYLSPNIYSSYTKSWDKHNFNVLVGYQQETYNAFDLSGSALYMLTDNIPSISTSVGTKTITDNIEHWSTQSYFGRLNYNFNDKYLLELNFRADGSSRFKPGNQWGNFPSISLGYNLAKENFFPLKKTFDLFKLRASYGKLGNQNVNNYLYVPIMGISQSTFLFNNSQQWAVGSPSLTSVNLTWETVGTRDIGIDLGLLNHRLTSTFDWYQADVTNLVGPGEALPAVLGTSVPLINSGKLRTKGWELELTWKDQIGKFSYNAKFMLSDYITKVTQYNNPTKLLSTYYEGQTLGEIWGYKTDGLFRTAQEVTDRAVIVDQKYIFSGAWYPGDLKYVDQNGDNKIGIGTNTKDDHGDKVILGNTTPRYKFGISAGCNWKGFDASFLIQGVGKRDVFVAMGGPAMGPFHANVFTYNLDYWRDDTSPLGANPNAFWAKPYSQNPGMNTKNYGTATDRYINNAAYVRLKNIQIGYKLPKVLIQKINLENVRIYLSGENLITLDKIKSDTDPETVSNAIYPLEKIISMGLNITF